MPKVSVIIPSFNASKYVDRCLSALENQVFKDFEIIVIDDCSTDDTVSKIEAWKEKSTLSIHLLQNEMNSGPAHSRNKGISHATGNFIAFCDIDDWYDENYLSEMVKAQSSNNADMVFCGYKLVFDSGKKILHALDAPFENTNNIKDVLLLGVDSLCTLIVRKEIISKIPQPDIRNGEDMAIIPLVIVQSRMFAFIKKQMYNYYCRSGSASTTPSLSVIDSLKKSFNHICVNMPDVYAQITEFIGIKNLLYGASLNIFKLSYDKDHAKRMITEFESRFPNWRNNEYITSLPIFKRIFIKSLSSGCYCLTFFLSKFHKIITT